MVLSSVHYYLFKLILLNQLHIGFLPKERAYVPVSWGASWGFCVCMGSSWDHTSSAGPFSPLVMPISPYNLFIGYDIGRTFRSGTDSPQTNGLVRSLVYLRAGFLISYNYILISS